MRFDVAKVTSPRKFTPHFYTFYPMQGTVKFFNDDKGYGFITPEDGSKDVFVHIKAVTGDIADGSSVTFDIKEGPKGLNAVNVQVQ
jgi:CspA family cold shock protein